jgi:hypothetical protein
MGKRRQATRAQEDRAGTANADRRQRWHAVANNTTELKPLLLATLTALVASFVLAGGLQRVQQELDVRGWLGRPALALTGARALLIVGTMGSGTTQRAAELRSLGLEVAHEASDSREVLCRDGTVSWAHGMRFLGGDLSPAQRAFVVDGLCSGPRFAAWSTTMFVGSPHCPRMKDKTYVHWSACWEAECKRVAAAELGCAVISGRSPCATPFAASLLQVRHPLRTAATLVKAFCAGGDSAASANRSVQLDTIDLLLPTPPPPPSPPPLPPAPEGPQPQAAPEGRGAAGDCARRFGCFWVNYVRAVRPHVDAWYRVENTSACAALRLAGVLGGGQGHGATAAAMLPSALAARVARQCAAEAAAAAAAAAAGQRDGTEAAHGRINSRNAGKRRVVLSMAGLAALDARLAEEMRDLGQELGYDV